MSTHPVQVGLRVLREIEVDDNVDRLDINPACEQVCKFRSSTAYQYQSTSGACQMDAS